MNVQNIKDFDVIALSIASPEDILSWSHGEITKPETINYRTQKPERDGLFCEKIFGPVKNWECACGKYKRVRYKGIVCERCGVEVTRAIVRRERMGHIKLAVPVTHTWFLRSTPSRVGLLLDLSVKELEQIVYFALYIVVEVDEESRKEALEELEADYKKLIEKQKEENGLSLKEAKTAVKNGDMTDEMYTGLENELIAKIEEVNSNFDTAQKELKGLYVGQTLTETVYRDISMKFGYVFRAGIGADALREIIQKLNLPEFLEHLKGEIKNASGQKEKKLQKRIKLVSSFIQNNIKPEWMILTAIPVIPPELRPMVQLDGGRFATSDLNDLYRRVINRNARLKKLIQLGAPEIICRNEKRMLQEAVDILISNSARNSKSGMSQVQKRKLRSLSDMLKGKQGRFRQNLLGKRVDYSGRSVIVVGPTLKLHECGIPKKIGLELFKPFVISKLIEFDYAHNVKSAEKLIRAGEKVVWDILDEVIRGKYVLLNRAPTLHRLGIQAFQPRLIEGKAIQLHPLVCAAFNADFDGDQMAIHLPLSDKAQEEAGELMLSSRNLLKPSSGEPIVEPSQDMVLGCYFLTRMLPAKKGEGMAFPSEEEAIFMYDSGEIHLQAKIQVRTDKEGLIETTVGRLIFNQILPEDYPYQNETFKKSVLNRVMADIYSLYGIEPTSALADRIKDLGFEFSTKSGISVSVYDFISPEEKAELIEAANSKIKTINAQYWHGLITDDERYNHTIKIWSKVKSDVTEHMITKYEEENDIFYQVDSGARGNWGQVTQIAGMKGLVASPSGRTIDLPIRSNLKEGFSILEYFIATHGGRKGKSDTALKTAEAGYLTRRLVDSVQDIIVREEACDTERFRVITQDTSTDLGIKFESRIKGRYVAQDIKKGSKVLIAKGTLIEDEQIEIVRENKLTDIPVYSVMYCKTLSGVCQQCYGHDLGKNKLVDMGTPVGIVAAQSIGEPGTQLTMRTFHMGGIATEEASITQGLTRVDELFEARTPKTPATLAEITGKVTITKGKKETKILIEAENPEKDVHHMDFGFEAVVKKGDQIAEKQIIARSTESKSTLKSRCSGVVSEVNAEHITILQGAAGKKEYSVSTGLTLRVKDGDMAEKGKPLTAGHIDLRELMELTEVERAQEYIMQEVLVIYTSQGQNIDEKHIELIVKQMASKVRIVHPGGSEWLSGDIKDIVQFHQGNEKLESEGKKPAQGQRMLLGLTRISLWTDSWLSAASFQETIRVLVEASTTKKVDNLDGLKENVIIGRLIPAGKYYNDRELAAQEKEAVVEEPSA